MDTLPRLFLAARFLLLCFAALLVPGVADAQQVLSVSPNPSTPISVTATVGTNAASQTVGVSNSGRGALKWTVVQPGASWLSVSPTSGVNNGTLTLAFSTSGLAVSATPYQTTFTINSNGGTATVTVRVTIVAAAPPPLVAKCPANITVASPDGNAVVVTYTIPTPSGGTSPYTTSGLPPSGSSFPVTTTTVQVTARDSSQPQQTATCSFTVTVTASPPTGGTLYVTCPANKSVTSSTGSAVAVTYSATTEGGVAPVTVEYFPASGSLFPVGTTRVDVNARSSDGQSSWCSFTVTVTSSSPPPSQLVANCPANITASSANGGSVPVTYTIPTPSGGTPPYTTSGSPPSGSNFPVGTTTVTVTAQDSAQPPQTATCTFTVTVTNSAPPSTGVGPQPTTCPSGAVNIFPGSSIQNAVNQNPAAMTFCLKSGIHYVTSAVTPRTGIVFVGEYGASGPAILDGIGWATTDDTQAAFRVYDDPNDPNDPNTPVDNVTIQNLVIRNMPQYGIHGSHTRSANNWTIANNEIGPNKTGLMFAANSNIRNNYIHHNVGNPSSPIPGERGGGYLGQFASNTTFDRNEIAYNGPEQKVGLSVNVRFLNNFVHHNVKDGIWYDLNNNNSAVPLAAIIQGNRIEDNGANGIVFEISIGAEIANNTFRRNGEDAVLITVSQNAQIHDNVLEDNLGGVEYFLNCGSFAEGFDLKNNATHDNTIFVGTHTFYVNGFSHLSQCTSTDLAPYLNGTKNLTFSHNTYHVPSLSFTQYFLWEGFRIDWNQWRALPPGHDQDGFIVSP